MSVLSEILIYSPLIIFVTTIMNNSNLVPSNLKEENKNKPISNIMMKHIISCLARI